MSPGRREGSLIFVDVALGGPTPSAQKAPPSDMMPLVRLESGKKGREWTLSPHSSPTLCWEPKT